MMRALAVGGVLAGLVACASVVEMPTASDGAVLFAENCTACHDYRGTGGGPLVGGQTAPDLTVLSRRNGGVFPRARVLTTMDGFGQGPHTGRVMPEFGALLRGDLVPVDIDGTMTPTPRPLAALLLYLESVQKG